MSLRGAEGDVAIDYNQLFSGLLRVARSDVSKFSHSLIRQNDGSEKGWKITTPHQILVYAACG